MKIINKKHFICWGFSLFLIAKFCLVFIPTLSLSSPRLGDDSLVYLWKGELAVNQKLNYSKAITYIKEQRFISDDSDSLIKWERSNTAQRTIGTGTEYLVHQFVAGAIKAINPKSVIAFSLTEIFGILLMLFGICTFSRALTDNPTTGFLLTVLATAVFPNQGINNFIPSTYALSFAFFLWGYIIQNREKVNHRIYLALTSLICLTHPIGKIYIFLAPIILLIYKPAFLKNKFVILSFISIFSACLPTLISYLFSDIQHPPSEIMGGISITSYSLFYNLDGSLSVIKDFAKKNILLTLLLLFAAWNHKRFSSQEIKLITLFWGTILLSQFHYLPGYPAELFSRLLLIAVLVTCSFSIKYLIHESRINASFKKILNGTAFALIIYSWFYWFNNYIPYTLNQRDEVINEIFLREKFEKIDTSKILLFAETTYSLPISLINGGYKFGVIAYPMLGKSSKEYIERYKPSFIIMPIDKGLNSLSKTNNKSFELRSSSINMR